MARQRDEKPSMLILWPRDYFGGKRVERFMRACRAAGIDKMTARGIWFTVWLTCCHTPEPRHPLNPAGKQFSLQEWSEEFGITREQARITLRLLTTTHVLERIRGTGYRWPKAGKSLCSKHKRKYGFGPDGAILDAEKFQNPPTNPTPSPTPTPIPTPTPESTTEIPDDVIGAFRQVFPTGRSDAMHALPAWLSMYGDELVLATLQCVAGRGKVDPSPAYVRAILEAGGPDKPRSTDDATERALEGIK